MVRHITTPLRDLVFEAKKWAFGFLFLAVALLILGWSDFASAISLNVYMASPRGGYGDTAANLLMIERLAEKYRESDIKLSVVYPEDAKQQIQVLWPDFRAEKEVQLLRGLLFFAEKVAPKADFAVSFSANEQPPQALGVKRILYYEYYQLDHELGSQTWLSDKSDRVTKSIFTLIGQNQVFAANTGFGNGLYVQDGFRIEDFNKLETFKRLKEFSPETEISGHENLGYAYASSQPLVQQYVNALEVYAKNHDREIIVVTNHQVTVHDSRIKIISMKGLSFNLNQKVIKSSDVPILVTGDGSLSLAIEGRKPFFYSLYAWKRNSPMALLSALQKASAALKKDRKSLELISSLLRLDVSGSRSYESEFLQVMENPELQIELSKVFDSFVKRDSLVEILGQDIQFVQSLKLKVKPDVFKVSLQLLWSEWRRQPNGKSAIAKFEKDIFNSRLDSAQRVRKLFSLMALQDISDEHFAKLFSKALVEGDIEFKFALADAIHDNHNFLDLENLLIKMDRAGQKEFVRIMKNLASQDPVQWGVNVYRAQEALKSIEEKISMTCEQLLELK